MRVIADLQISCEEHNIHLSVSHGMMMPWELHPQTCSKCVRALVQAAPVQGAGRTPHSLQLGGAIKGEVKTSSVLCIIP